MKVTIKKTFTNEDGTSFLKGRVLDVTEDVANKLALDGIIDVIEKPAKKVKKGVSEKC